MIGGDEIWVDLRRGRVFPAEPLTGFLGFAGLRRNLVPAGSLRRLVPRHVEHEFLEDLPIPLHVIACDVLTGTPISHASRRVQPTDFSQARELIDRGYESARAFLDHPRLPKAA